MIFFCNLKPMFVKHLKKVMVKIITETNYDHAIRFQINGQDHGISYRYHIFGFYHVIIYSSGKRVKSYKWNMYDNVFQVSKETHYQSEKKILMDQIDKETLSKCADVFTALVNKYHK